MADETGNDEGDAHNIVVIERTRADYPWARRGIQQTLEEESGDPAFARWLADPKSGRFLVLDYLQVSIELMVQNADSEQELIEFLSTRLASHLNERRVPNLGLYVTSEVEANVRRVCSAIA